MIALRVAYAANILVLVPVLWALLRGRIDAVFEGTVLDSPALRWLVASLWSAILIASIAGLALPTVFVPILLLQVFYKSMWLLAFALPALRHGKPYPRGVAVSFLAIALTYPILLLLAFG